MMRRPPRSTLDRSSAASDVYKRQVVVLVMSSIALGAGAAPVELIAMFCAKPGATSVARARKEMSFFMATGTVDPRRKVGWEAALPTGN